MRISEARKILGVSPTDSPEEIKAVYRRMAMKHHPDRGGDQATFVKVKEAFETLERSDFAASDTIFTQNPFSGPFPSGFSGTWSTIPDPPRNATIKISILDAFNGARKSVNLFGKVVDVDIPAGVSEDVIVHSTMVDGQQWNILVKIESNSFKIDWEGSSRANVKTDFYVSPFRMILGGWAEAEMFDGTIVSVRIPPGLEANKMLKVQGRGYWKNQQCYDRGDCLLRVIPAIQKLDEIPVDHIKEFVDAYSKIIDPSI